MAIDRMMPKVVNDNIPKFTMPQLTRSLGNEPLPKTHHCPVLSTASISSCWSAVATMPSSVIKHANFASDWQSPNPYLQQGRSTNFMMWIWWSDVSNLNLQRHSTGRGFQIADSCQTISDLYIPFILHPRHDSSWTSFQRCLGEGSGTCLAFGFCSVPRLQKLVQKTEQKPKKEQVWFKSLLLLSTLW